MQTNPIYAFDIDGVLCHTRSQHKREIEAELGVTLYEDERGHYDAWGFYHDSDEVMTFIREQALILWQRPSVAGNGTPNGQAVILELAKRDQFAGYVTRRHPKLYRTTYFWLKNHGFYLSPVVTLKSAHAALELHPQLRCTDDDFESKARHVRQLGATALVEDSPKEALSAAEKGLDVVVLRANYNREFELICNAKRDEGDQYGVLTVFHRIRFISALEELL